MTPQPNSTSAACPKSGCSARKPTITNASAKEIALPGGPFRSWLAEISQALRITKNGLRNSEGWTEAKPIENQRTAPLPKSVPKIGSSARAAKAPTKPSTPSRRTRWGDIIEVPSIARIASPPKAIWRWT